MLPNMKFGVLLLFMQAWGSNKLTNIMCLEKILQTYYICNNFHIQ